MYWLPELARGTLLAIYKCTQASLLYTLVFNIFITIHMNHIIIIRLLEVQINGSHYLNGSEYPVKDVVHAMAVSSFSAGPAHTTTTAWFMVPLKVKMHTPALTTPTIHYVLTV